VLGAAARAVAIRVGRRSREGAAGIDAPYLVGWRADRDGAGDLAIVRPVARGAVRLVD
jgi:hypothetical protein